MIVDLIKLLRPTQWVKNFFVLAPLFFSMKFLEIAVWQNIIIATICFILISGFVYILNDLADTEEDKLHPKKKFRPIASGRISSQVATIASLIVLALAVILLGFLPTKCAVVIAIYITLQLAYSHKLKHMAIYDVIIIATGFVVRVLMGAYAIDVPVSPWIIVTTYLLALFLGFGKRYHEFSIPGYEKKRMSLTRYSKAFLDKLITITCASAFITYTLYTVETARLLHKTELVYTVIFVVIGLFLYLQVIYVDNKGGEPEQILLKNKTFIINGLMWFVSTIWILSY